MCSNYRPVTRMDRMLTFFGVERAKDEIPKDVFPTGIAPFIRLAKDGSGNRVIDDGHFGLVPHFIKELAYGRRTYNARSETVAKLPSFRAAWARAQRCIVPAEAIYEPCYESGKSIRFRISQHGDVPMGIAGIYTDWTDTEGVVHFSFAMLTVNADGHPVFKRMHRPEDEKRMVVILDPANYDDWLGCPVADAPKYFQQWMGQLIAEADALPPRAPRTASGKVVAPPPPVNPDPETGELF